MEARMSAVGADEALCRPDSGAGGGGGAEDPPGGGGGAAAWAGGTTGAGEGCGMLRADEEMEEAGLVGMGMMASSPEAA